MCGGDFVEVYNDSCQVGNKINLIWMHFMPKIIYFTEET